MPTDEEFAALKTEVARLTQMVEQLYYRTAVPIPPQPVPGEPPAEVVALVEQGRLIEAIKEWRGISGLTLAEAKRDIDAVARRLGR